MNIVSSPELIYHQSFFLINRNRFQTIICERLEFNKLDKCIYTKYTHAQFYTQLFAVS